jgi:hypothetical protein
MGEPASVAVVIIQVIDKEIFGGGSIGQTLFSGPNAFGSPAH